MLVNSAAVCHPLNIQGLVTVRRRLGALHRYTRTFKGKENELCMRTLLCLLALLLPGCGTRVEPSDVPETIKRTARSTTVSMVSVGDILLGNDAAEQLELHGYDWPFEYVRTLLSDADVVIGNLEGPITTAKNGRSNSAYGAKPASASALKRAGFHALSLANNHALDF